MPDGPDFQPMPDPGWWVYGRDPDETCEETVQDRRRFTRGQAKQRYANITGEAFTSIRCRASHGRCLTIQERWDDWGADRWLDSEYFRRVDANEEWDDEIVQPKTPPAEWQPDPEAPSWQECAEHDPGACPIWIVSGDDA